MQAWGEACRCAPCPLPCLPPPPLPPAHSHADLPDAAVLAEDLIELQGRGHIHKGALCVRPAAGRCAFATGLCVPPRDRPGNTGKPVLWPHATLTSSEVMLKGRFLTKSTLHGRGVGVRVFGTCPHPPASKPMQAWSTDQPSHNQCAGLRSTAAVRNRPGHLHTTPQYPAWRRAKPALCWPNLTCSPPAASAGCAAASPPPPWLQALVAAPRCCPELKR